MIELQHDLDNMQGNASNIPVQEDDDDMGELDYVELLSEGDLALSGEDALYVDSESD